MSSIINKFKSFDIYRDIPKDLTEQTITGAIVSIVCALFIAYLFTAEFFSYLTVETHYQMYVDSHIDTGNDHAMIRININISVPAVPCAVMSVDVQDIMGAHLVDVGGELHKTRLSSSNVPLVDANGIPLPAEGKGVEPAKQKGEGCNVNGYIIVKRVPGNFHISAHAHAQLYSMFFPDKPMNLSHVINNLSFGDHSPDEFDLKESGINPLKNCKKIVFEEVHGGKSFEYYVKIVPMRYEKLNGEVLDSFQYVANSNEIVGQYAIPALYFRYDMSPIAVKFSKKSKVFSHFLVQVCAIIGGVFTVMGNINSMLNTTKRKLIKKTQLQKLG